jgi:hypothetical protein
MTVTLRDDVIVLEGPSRVEDAKPLLALLRSGHNRGVDLSAAEPLHTAVFQVLLVCRPGLLKEPGDPFNRTLLAPLLTPDPAR